MNFAGIRSRLTTLGVKLNAKLLQKLGYDVMRWKKNVVNRRMTIINRHGIDVILDVGANVGQYASESRRLGYEGRIVSFEPLRSAFRILTERCREDPLWEAMNMALGDTDKTSEINIAKKSVRSSILDMSAERFEIAPNKSDEEFIGKETIEMRRLDTVFDQCVRHNEAPFLKLDVQGYEETVLKGAINSMERIRGMQIELSLAPMYKGEMLMMDMIELMRTKGFILESLEPGFYNPETGRLLQVDGVFFREGRIRV
ncbi:MAG: FkbM family methyltransferase [Proteobacteria bacterium]|nr:FkbM family methyltransferase [Pseudomonadota bacterium]